MSRPIAMAVLLVIAAPSLATAQCDDAGPRQAEADEADEPAMAFALARDVGARPGAGPRFEVGLAEGLVDGPTDGRLVIVLARGGRGEPRQRVGDAGPGAPALVAAEVRGLAPGGSAALDDAADCFPVERPSALPPGDYTAQAVLMTNRDLLGLNMPGNLVGEPTPVAIGGESDRPIRLSLTRKLPPDETPADTEWVKYLKFPSARLSAFHGRPMFLRVAVIIPRGFDPKAERPYPLRVQIGGFGTRYTAAGSMMAPGSGFRRIWEADDTPRMVLLHLDGAGPLGDPYQVDSANHGPYGAAIMEELIPEVERRFRCGGSGANRVTDGGSTGGWVSLALQVFYPDSFAGCWSSCPDPVDFRSFQRVNIYDDANAYVAPDGTHVPSSRGRDGTVRYTMRRECSLENALGVGGSWALSGGQWGSWNATFGPRAADGKPVALWDPKTGAIDRATLPTWEKYDIRRLLERDWATLGPKLRGKLRIWVGEADDFYLNEAVHKLDAFLRRADPPADALIEYGPGQGHCWRSIDERRMMQQMAEATGARP